MPQATFTMPLPLPADRLNPLPGGEADSGKLLTGTQAKGFSPLRWLVWQENIIIQEHPSTSQIPLLKELKSWYLISLQKVG